MAADRSAINRIGDALHGVSRLSARLEDSLLILILSAMVILAATQIALRNIWDTGISWSDPALRIAVLWLGLLGALAAVRDRNHISIDAVSRLLPPLGKRLTSAIAQLFSSAVCGLIAYHAWRFVMMEKEDGIIAFADVPAWICEIIIPIGFGLMAIRFFFNATSDLVGYQPPEQRNAP